MMINFKVGDTVIVSAGNVDDTASLRITMTISDIVEDDNGYVIAGTDGQEITLPNAECIECEECGTEYRYGDYVIALWRF